MGQYHYTVNLDKREYLQPHKFGEGLKLWEQGWHGFGIQRALQMLLAISDGRGGGDFHLEENGFKDIAGRWAGDRIVVLGDYTEDEDFPNIPHASMLYSLCRVRNDEDKAKTVEHIREWKGDEVADWFLAQEPFTDISELVRAPVEALVAKYEGYVYKDNGGWGDWVKAANTDGGAL